MNAENMDCEQNKIRCDWSRDEISAIYRRPLLDLIYGAATVHRQFHDPRKLQLCTLLSIKTGGCPEDCSYCAQSSRYSTGVKAERLMSVDAVIDKAKKAKAQGSTRFCMGAAWREVRDGNNFETILEIVRQVKALGLQVCVTLGMLNSEQAQRLKEAGVYAYNHNLDTSESFYPQIITTRTYQDRLQTLKEVRKAGMTICCGGILGLGEGHEDRIDLIHTLACLNPHPESVPINALEPVPGTPLEKQKKVPVWDRLRVIATVRLTMPKAMVRLSAGRLALSAAEQALCFMAGANSIWNGSKLLTVPNSAPDEDQALLEALGLEALEESLEEQACSSLC